MARENYEVVPGQSERSAYSSAVRVDDTIYVAGTLGIGDDGAIPDSVAEQMTLVYRNIDQVLHHFGCSLDDVVEQHVFVTDLEAAMQAMHVRKAAYGGGNFPTSTMVEVSKLGLGAKVEISVTAYKAS
jgi:enamine deaminase RidA (YjgF/YER057c/UK114 family)